MPANFFTGEGTGQTEYHWPSKQQALRLIVEDIRVGIQRIGD